MKKGKGEDKEGWKRGNDRGNWRERRQIETDERYN